MEDQILTINTLQAIKDLSPNYRNLKIIESDVFNNSENGEQVPEELKTPFAEFICDCFEHLSLGEAYEKPNGDLKIVTRSGFTIEPVRWIESWHEHESTSFSEALLIGMRCAGFVNHAQSTQFISRARVMSKYAAKEHLSDLFISTTMSTARTMMLKLGFWQHSLERIYDYLEVLKDTNNGWDLKHTPIEIGILIGQLAVNQRIKNGIRTGGWAWKSTDYPVLYIDTIDGCEYHDVVQMVEKTLKGDSVDQLEHKVAALLLTEMNLI